MAATLEQIAGFFKKRNVAFRRDEGKGWLIVPFAYAPLDPLIVAVALEEDGRFLKIFAPRLLKYGDGPHKLALMQTLLLTSWESKMLQWEYDPIDGEVRAMVEFPIEDAALTEQQFFRAFDGLSRLAMLYYPRLKSVIETGSDPGRADVAPEAPAPAGGPPDAL
jgi:hypothetical protein